MAEKKFLDKDGVGYLYQKARQGVLTEATLDSRLEYINYISNESVSSQSKSASSSTDGETKSVSITDSGFEYGKAKRLSLTVAAKVSGVHREDYSGTAANKITVQVKLPSSGTWFFYNGASVQLLSGGSVVTSFSATAEISGAEATTTKTYTFYLAKVK